MSTQRFPIAYNNARPFLIEPGIYTVEVGIGNGISAYHVGPGTYPYFTLEQATKLATRVCAASSIDPDQWTDGYLRPLTMAHVVPVALIHLDCEE